MAKKHLEGRAQFDFLIGCWRIRHRRLKERLAKIDDWIEFDGGCVTRKILDNAGNIDEHSLDMPGHPYSAMAIRTYDSAQDCWSIWWIDGRQPTELDPPLVGRFKDGVGTFYADHVLRDKPIRVRFLWTNLAVSPHWEQAFSADGGLTWEVNWTMEWQRIA